MSYEYHFWRHQAYDLGGVKLAKRINEDVKVYKQYDVNGIIEDGSQRSFFPTGLAFYTYARTLYDNSLSAEEIAEEYLSCAFGEDWRSFFDYLESLEKAVPFEYLNGSRKEGAYDPCMAENIRLLKDLVAEGRELIKAHYNSEYRVRTVSVRLLELHALMCDMLADALAEKCVGNDGAAMELFNKMRIAVGAREAEFERYYDHGLWMPFLKRAVFLKPSPAPILI